uniref:Uncharacterized protein n=1 Tax=Anguilla anguilla TaxID=7936 RepID=A0A0E9SX40_ANGAN
MGLRYGLKVWATLTWRTEWPVAHRRGCASLALASPSRQ